ncbi:hypothetical protein LUZ61_007831 [Rhynchospora tenuis]|uniref:F-box domain-containing protein n=1 Tax=Rhynchospora tenuis TaxID=198213 RepID=A0AAD6EWW9_9POAL|nr:hypothetical protein LUZ61_007831 [Rhynchospora tenuis]
MAGEDRLSSLPSELKVSILSRLSVKDAVRTSILARSWHHLWTFRPRLSLGSYLDPLGDTGNINGRVASSWIERVHHVVSSLRGPLLHFALSDTFLPDQSALLQRLLYLLHSKGCLERLHLSTGYSLFDRVEIHLPSFHSLKELQLCNCRIVLPTGFQGFIGLSTLSLQFVQISNHDLNLLIHISNSLTTLECTDIKPSKDQFFSIKLSLPSLRYLKFYINCNIRTLEVVSAPCLEHAYIWNCGYSDLEKFTSLTLGLVTSVVMVSSLDLEFDVLKPLSLAALPSNFTFPGVRKLKLRLTIQTMDKRIYDAFLWLLRSMLFLEELTIEVADILSDATRVDVQMKELFSTKHNGLSCLDKTLKTLTIDMEDLVSVTSVMTRITFVKFFMLNARALELMNVVYWTDSELTLNIIEELQKAKVTTSSKANVVIIRQIENVTDNVVIRL